MSTNTTSVATGQYADTAVFEPDEEGGYVVTVFVRATGSHRF